MSKQENLVVCWDECDEVLRNRYEEAFAAGFTCKQALEFAASDRDIGVLRKVIKNGCPKKLIPKIVL